MKTLNFPYSFQTDFVVYNYTASTNSIIALGASGTEYLDASRNVVLLDMTYTTPTQTINFLLQADFKTGVSTVYYPANNHCEKQAMGKSVNLKSLLDKINGVNAGYVEYVGPVTIPWNGESATGYDINPL